MRVPLGGGHWVSIQSNKAMTPEAWRRFNLHLDLQHDIWAEDPASAGEAGTATTTKIGVVHEHATGEAGDAQKGSQ